MDVGGREPAPGGEDAVVGDDGLEEVKEVVVLVVLGTLKAPTKKPHVRTGRRNGQGFGQREG